MRGDDGGALAGNIDQDRRGGAAVLGPVVEAGQHDERRHRRQREGDRQQHGDGGDRPEPRQHADQRAEQRADQAEQQVLRRHGDAEAEDQVLCEIAHVPLTSTRPAAAATGP